MKFHLLLIKKSLNKYLLIATLIFSLIFVLLSFFSNRTIAQENQTTAVNILFVREDCSFCQMLKDDISNNEIEGKITLVIKDISSIGNRDEFDAKVEKCNIENAGTPLLVKNEECFLGYYLAKDELFRQAGIQIEKTQDDTSEQSSQEQIQKADKSEAELYADMTSIPSSANENDKENKETVSNQNSNNSSVSKDIPEFSLQWYEILILIIVPIIFVTISYLAITRLKL